MLARLRRATKDDQGASAVEYGLLVAAIAAIVVVIVFAFGNVVRDIFTQTCQSVTTAGENAGPSVFEDDACANGEPADPAPGG